MKSKMFVWTVVAMLAISMLLAGCSTKGVTTSAETTAAETTAGEATSAETTAAETTAAEKIELNFWDTTVPDTAFGKWFMEAIAEFEAKNPNITIKYTQQPSTTTNEILQTLLAANAGPDIMGFWTGINAWPFKDYLNDLKQYVSEETLNTFVDSNRDVGYYLYDRSQKLLDLPEAGVGFTLWVYNKKMFKDAGITFEPTKENHYRMTWDEFLDACNKLKTKGITPLGAPFAGENGGTISWFTDIIGQNYFAEEDVNKVFKHEIKYDDPKWVETYTRIQDLYKAGYFNKDSLTLGWGDGVNLINNGKCAIQPAYWGYNTTWVKDQLKGDFGMMLSPVINPDNPLSWTTTEIIAGSLIVPVWSKHPQEAANFIAFMDSEEQYIKCSKATGSFPPLKNFDPANIADPIDKLAYEMMTSENHTLWNRNFLTPPEWLLAVGGQTVPMLKGEITPQQLCDNVEKIIAATDYEWMTK